MSRRSLAAMTLLAVFAFVSTHHAARADEFFPFVRLTCLPQQDYAEIETLGLWNIAGDSGNIPPSLAADGLHDLSKVAEKPLICDLPLGAVRIKLTRYHAPQATGMCGGVEDADMQVTVDGMVVADAKSTHGGCFVEQRHLVWVQAGEAFHCVVPYQDARGQPLSAGTCHRVRLPRH